MERSNESQAIVLYMYIQYRATDLSTPSRQHWPISSTYRVGQKKS